MVTTEAKTTVKSDDPFIRAVEVLRNQAQSLGDEILWLWDDAIHFWQKSVAKAKTTGVGSQEHERLLRAAVLTAGAAFEAFTNFLSFRITGEGLSLSEFEADVLRETKREVRGGEVREVKGKYPAQERFLLLYRIVSGGEQFEAQWKNDLESAFEIRDAIVHPKPGNVLRLSVDERGSKAALGFLSADMFLALEAAKRTQRKGAFNRLGGGLNAADTPPKTNS
jgi:hypothetical protein